MWGVTLLYDASVVAYSSLVSSSHFGSPSVTTSPGSILLQVLSTDGNPAHAASRRGVFYLFRARFRLLPGHTATATDVGIRLRIDEFTGTGKARLVTNVLARVMDHRDNAAANHATAEIVGAIAQPIGLFVANARGTGQVFHAARLTGIEPTDDRTYSAVTVTDQQNGPLFTLPSTALTSCATTSGSDRVTFSIESGKCRGVLPATATTGPATLLASDGTHSASYSFRVVSPERVEISLADSVLGRLQAVQGATFSAAACAAQEGVYQRTAVRVLADGVDVTSMLVQDGAPLVQSSDPSVAEVLIADGLGTITVQGRAEGSAQIRLFAGSTTNTLVSVTSGPVSVSRMINKLVTGISWVDAPSSEYSCA